MKDSGLFNITMTAYHRVEISGFIGIYLLSLLSSNCDKKIFGLYRDDGRAVFKNIFGPKSERI